MQEFSGLIRANQNFHDMSDDWKWYDVIDKTAVPRGHNPDAENLALSGLRRRCPLLVAHVPYVWNSFRPACSKFGAPVYITYMQCLRLKGKQSLSESAPAAAPAEPAADAPAGIFQELAVAAEEERPAQQLSIFSIFHKSSYPSWFIPEVSSCFHNVILKLSETCMNIYKPNAWAISYKAFEPVQNFLNRMLELSETFLLRSLSFLGLVETYFRNYSDIFWGVLKNVWNLLETAFATPAETV